MLNNTQKPVLFEELNTADGHILGVITLNNERQLHALTAPMFTLLQRQLLVWQNHERVVAVFITSTGERAFCAGGDVKALQQALVATPSEQAKQQLISQYFSAEYAVDYLLHKFSKPIIAWGDGIIMGGGLGLFMGASHRVVTETARIAMPEITIGLFPDVGATWFLNRLPHAGVGLFLGLTGASINGKDAEYLALSPYLLARGTQAQILAQLQHQLWSVDRNEHAGQVDVLLRDCYDDSHFPVANLPAHQPLFTALSEQQELTTVVTMLAAAAAEQKPLEQTPDQVSWLQQSCAKLQQGSPISAHILFRQITRYPCLSLADCFRLELNLAVNVCLNGDLCEGVRALLVDKDQQPNWRYPHVNSVPQGFVERLFIAPWSDSQHPLVQLN